MAVYETILNGKGVTTTTRSSVHIYDAKGPIIIGDKANLYANTTRSPTKEGTRQDHLKATTSSQNASSIVAPEDGSYEQLLKNERPRGQDERHYAVLPPCCRNHEKTDQQQPCGYTNITPTPSNDAVAENGIGSSHKSVSSFLENVDMSMDKFDKMAGPLWEEKEKFILRDVMSSLKRSWRKSNCRRTVVYMAMAKISCSRSSVEVVRYTLQQLLGLLQDDDLADGRVNLLRIEKVVRESINSPDAVFKEEGDEERKLRLSVYNQILTMMSIQNAREQLCVVDIREQLSRMQKDLTKYLNPTMERFRYFIEIARQAIAYLLKPKQKFSNVKAFLGECQATLENRDYQNMNPSFLDKLRNPRGVKQNWFASHCTVCYLRGKICSDGIQTDKGALLLLRRIFAACREGGDESDWKFCLQMQADLGVPDIATTDVTKGSFNADKSYMIIKEKDGAVIRERLRSENKKIPLHWRRLLKLDHNNICFNLEIHPDSSHLVMEIISTASSLGNLKDYVLNGNCEEDTIFAFMSQIASALRYLHENHIVHGNLRAEHVNVVDPCQSGHLQVQVVRFGRSKSLVPRADKSVKITSMVHADVPLDSTRWSAPEVISKGSYSHASDVYAFGVVVWEMFAALTFGRERQHEQTSPYCELSSKDENGGLLSKPHRCPDWVYSMIQQCCACQPQQRPSSFDLFDCLTSRNPMQYWKSWLGHHKNMEQHDPLNFGPPAVRHETKGGNHPSKEDNKILSECVSTNHNYDYITNPLIAKGCRNEDKSYLYSKRSAFGRDVSLDISEYATLLKAECKRLIQESVPGNRVHKFHTI